MSPAYKDGVTDQATSTPLSALLPTLMDELPQVIREVVGLLRDEWPDYAAFLEEDPEGVADTAQAAVSRLVQLAGRTPVGPGGLLETTAGGAELFEELGRIEWREGRSLSTLLSAYRAGARVAWQHMSRLALARRVDPEAIAHLAEAVFVFVEELSSASARGYVEEQLATAGQRERMRGDLADLLLSERADLPLVHAAAAAAGWPLPNRMAIVVVDPAAAGEFLGRVDSRVLPIRRPELTGAILADPDGPGRRARLAAALRGMGAVVGPTVRPADLPATVRLTLAADRLRRDATVIGDPVFVDEHYDALIVHGDARLHGLLTEQVLRPLDNVPAGSRARLEETLAVWLRYMGDRQEVARVLHVHPQTVRYRIGRLRQLFGPALDDPDTRLRMTLATCWRPPTPHAGTAAGAALPPGAAS